MNDRNPYLHGRRAFMRAGVGIAGGLVLPGALTRALAADHPPVGTWPQGARTGARGRSWATGWAARSGTAAT